MRYPLHELWGVEEDPDHVAFMLSQEENKEEKEAEDYRAFELERIMRRWGMIR